ncbi:MAG: NADH-quinone oxidoreductase subunit NuoN [Legionellaceae bacterium]|nr:NADH-quinone oxidoreductase subunit NuoN [Legionellaceae bacterium]
MTLFANIHLALPEIMILSTAVLALLADLFLKERAPSAPFILASLGLFLAASCSFMYLGNYRTILLHGMFVSDDMAQLMKLFIYISVYLSFVYSRKFLQTHEMASGDYYVLGLFATLGMMIMVSAYSMLSLYLGLELLSLPLYAMTAMRRTDGIAAEAAMKYFVMGSIASGMLLYGMSLLYGATGQLQLGELANTIATNWQQETSLLSFALVFIIAGLGFKLAAAPFHMWAPDIYAGAPSSVTLFIGAAPKIAALGILFRMLTIGLVDISAQWQQLVLVMALLSTGLGNILAIVQNNIKRLLAYSAISHIGYALFGVLAGNEAGYAAALYYILMYSLMSVAALGLLVLLSQRTDILYVDDLKGLNRRHPWLALMMLLVMFSMAGVPPLVGFFAKMLVLKALIDVQLTWVAVIGLLFAVVGAFYYLRVVKVMYFDEAESSERFSIGPAVLTMFSVNCLLLLYFGLFPSALINSCISAFTGF